MDVYSNLQLPAVRFAGHFDYTSLSRSGYKVRVQLRHFLLSPPHPALFGKIFGHSLRSLSFPSFEKEPELFVERYGTNVHTAPVPHCFA